MNRVSDDAAIMAMEYEKLREALKQSEARVAELEAELVTEIRRGGEMGRSGLEWIERAEKAEAERDEEYRKREDVCAEYRKQVEQRVEEIAKLTEERDEAREEALVAYASREEVYAELARKDEALRKLLKAYEDGDHYNDTVTDEARAALEGE